MTLLIAAAFAQDIPAGERIDNAVAAVAGDAAFDELGGIVGTLVPEDIALDPTGDSDGWGCVNYAYLVENMTVDVAILDTDFGPGDGVIDVEVDTEIAINDASNPFDLTIELFCNETFCPGYVDPFPATLKTSIALSVVEVDGQNVLDATVAPFELDNGLVGDDIHLDCAIGDVETVLSWFGLSLYDLIIGALESQLSGQLEDMRADMETQLEEAFSALTIDEVVALGDAELRIVLEPEDVRITPDDFTLVLGGNAEASSVAECIADDDPGSSAGTTGDVPGADALGDHHAAILVSDDFGNQAAYAAWRSGLLCQTVAEGAGLTLTTDILSALTGGVHDELFDDSRPLTLAIRPHAPPELATSEAVPAVTLERFGMDMIAEVDDRMARVVGLEMDALVGIPMNFDETTGELAIEVSIDEETLSAQVVHNELVAGTDEEVATAFVEGIGPFLDVAIGALAGSLSFNMPAFEGIGVTGLSAGFHEDWLSIGVNLGEPQYEPSSCEDGCSGGCSTGGGLSGLALFLALGALRRRHGLQERAALLRR